MKNRKLHLKKDVKQKALEAILYHKQSVQQVAVTLGVHRSNIYRWLKRNSKGIPLDRVKNPKAGRQSKLCSEKAKNILQIIKKPASEYGYDSDFWTTKRIAQVVKKEIQLNLSIMSVHRMLVKYKYIYNTPERRYYEANTIEQKKWQKIVVPQIKKIIKKHNAILYFLDEANVSLSPVIGKTWAPVGKKAITKVTGNRASISAISAISKDGRLIFNIHDNNKRYCAKDIIHFLSQMLSHHSKRHLVVVLDQAACHKAKVVQEYVKKQKRLHLFYLPPRSPEFNPDEKVWCHLKHQELKSHTAKTGKELKKITSRKLLKMSKDRRVLRGIYLRSEGASFFY